MNPPTTLLTIDDVTARVHTKLADDYLALKPKAVAARPVIDGLGEDAWQLVLTLPKPIGPTWDVEEVFDVRRAAIEAFDDLLAGENLERPGQTLAVVTTDEADEADIAAEELPEEDEDPTGEGREDAE